MRNNDEERIQAMRDSTIGKIVGPTILMGSGTYFDFEDPESSKITIEDVAWGLAGATRFSGQTINSRTGKRCFYNVAQHCVLMSMVVPKHLSYDALMHELGEAPCGDVSGPLKSICPDFKRIEKRAASAIEHRFGVTMEDPVTLKTWDIRMLVTEKRDLMPQSRSDQWSWTKGERPITNLHIVPWAAERSAEVFLWRYHDLRKQGFGCDPA